MKTRVTTVTIDIQCDKYQVKSVAFSSPTPHPSEPVYIKGANETKALNKFAKTET